MGEIWLARDLQLDEQVALKLLSQTFSQPSFVDLLRQECRKARTLVHPNIVRVHDFHASDSHYFISMQYIDGDTLVASRGAPFQFIAHQALMVCDALEYAHRSGIIHRDVKPSNVLRNHEEVCYLSDFGIAAAIAGGPPSADLRGGGSLPSMSPQQLAGEPAAVADDVYSLGALLYELLSGAPLFHPGVTETRIREEEPEALTRDGAGQQIPEPMLQVVHAMLDKTAERRPAGIGAVRSVLEEVCADYPLAGDVAEFADTGGDVIKPVSRAARTGSPAEVAARTGRRPGDGKHHSARLVFAGLGALLLVALAVIFFLPKMVDEQAPVVRQRIEAKSEPAPMGDNDPGASRAQQKIADAVLGELIVIDDGLRALGIELWGGSDWSDARELSETGDARYRDRDYAGALTHYRQALTRMELIELRAPQVLAETLRDGQAALEAMDQELAVRNFEIAIAIDRGNPDARAGLERAMHLDEVQALMSRARELEKADALADARDVYAQVMELDPAWQPARDGFARTGATLARNEYERRMAAGFSAMASEEIGRARTAFSAALTVRPGDATATEVLKQLDAEERLHRIIDLQKTGRAAEAQENWTLAESKYAAIVDIDHTVVSAGQDLQRVRQRAEMHARLDHEINNADRFNDDKIARSANALLEQARSVDNPGPVVRAQIDQLAELLRIAAIPVRVEFQSDNLTDVVIYKVGRLGTFLTRTLDLKPGGYVVVGSREGYRDVRRTFQVAANGNMQPIVLSCEEPI